MLFESTPVYPDPGRYWETVQRLGINQFYGAPTAIRLLLKYGDDWVTKYDRSSLKTLGSVGKVTNTSPVLLIKEHSKNFFAIFSRVCGVI